MKEKAKLEGPTVAALLIVTAILWSLFPAWTAPVDAQEVPEGYKTLEDLTSLYPAIVKRSGDDYQILADLNLPATRPLYIGPGESVLLAENVHLNLSGPPIMSGSESEPIVFEPLVSSSDWSGIYILERDPSAGTLVSNTTIKGAKIGIWVDKGELEMENSRIIDSSMHGLEVRGPLDTGGKVILRNVEVKNATFNGVQLFKVQDAAISDFSATGCGTGIRIFRSTLEMERSRMIGTMNVGINIVDSQLEASEIVLGGQNDNTSQQLLSTNSTALMEGISLTGCVVGIYALGGSEIRIGDLDIGPCFLDGIWSVASAVFIDDGTVHDCGESAIQIDGSTLEVTEMELVNNGRGAGGYVYSSIIAKDSSIDADLCSFTGSGDAHIELYESSMELTDSILGATNRDKIILDLGSELGLIDVVPPSDIDFKDGDSRVIYSRSLVVMVKNFTSGLPIEGATVDAMDVDGNRLFSAVTDVSGSTGSKIAPISIISGEGTLSYLPIDLVAVKEGYEVSSASMEIPSTSVTISMYPPNKAPELSIIEPGNGTSARGTLRVKGSIDDDLSVWMLRYRFDSGAFSTLSGENVFMEGSFDLELALGGVSPGPHTLTFHAFDGSHLSPPQIRSIVIIGSGINDTDEDLIPDGEEDKNGNGIVDPGETDPNNPDTDGDFLIDGLEIDKSDGNDTDPLNWDTDGDFLLDGNEDQNRNGRVDENETDPNNPDTDGDGVNDKDDKYPLDPFRSDDGEGDPGSLAVLIMAVVLIFLLLIAAYLVYVKTRSSGGGNPPEEEEKTVRRARRRAEPPKRRPEDERKGRVRSR
ncbi:MAG: right-handed parallel beta-helix repeat-containing protein [Thermoplasmatota archaeon]